MKKSEKGWIFLLLCLLMAAGLTACGEDQSVSEEEEDVLIYAALNPISKDLENLVKWFNSKHEGMRMEVRDYSDEGGIERLRTELILGQVPDIVEMHYYGKKGPQLGTNYDNCYVIPGSYADAADEYWMPYRQMVQKGYLEDLWPYIENDPDLRREGVLQAPLKAAEVNGGLYMLFRKTAVFTLMGRESVVGSRTSWTLEELMEVYSGMPEGSTILRYNMTKREVFFNLLRFSLGRYVDRGAGECLFGSQGFRELVLFLDSFPDELDYEDPVEAEEEIIRRIRDGKQMLEGNMIIWPQDIPFSDAVWQERAAFPGYPTADGSSGNFFYPIGTILAMSATCRDKSAAWDFIRRSFLKPVLTEAKPLVSFSYIPVNLHDYELIIWGDLQQADKIFGLAPKHFKYGPEMPMLHPLDEEDVQRYRDLVDSTTQLYWPEDDLTNIVWETLGAYFAEDRTLDDTIRLLENRVSLYLNEQK